MGAWQHGGSQQAWGDTAWNTVPVVTGSHNHFCPWAYVAASASRRCKIVNYTILHAESMEGICRLLPKKEQLIN